MSRYLGLLKAFTRAFELQLLKLAFWAKETTCLIRIPPRLWPSSSRGRFEAFTACQMVHSIRRAKNQPSFFRDEDILETDLLHPKTALANYQRLGLSCIRIAKYEQTAAAVVSCLGATGCRSLCLATCQKHGTLSLWDSIHELLRY